MPSVRLALSLFLLMVAPWTSRAVDAPKPVPPGLTAFLEGTWTGSGEFASGKKISAAASFASELGGQWLSYRHEDRPPGRYQALGLWGYDRQSGDFVMSLHDSGGGLRRFSSTGWTQGGIVFERGEPDRERFRFERLDDDRMKMTYERGDGAGWKMVDYVVFVRESESKK